MLIRLRKVITFLLSKKILLIAILVLGFALRFYRVADDPPSLNWDEVSIGYNAYSIMKTGRDEWSVFLPIHFKSYGEYKLPIQIYGSIPGIAIFGLNDFGVRITPVVYGTATIILIYLLAVVLFESEWIALLSALLLATSPWHIQLTRASFESSFSVFWVLLGLWFLIKGFKKQKWLWISMIPFAISVYTYNAARVFTPLFLLAVLIIYRKELFKFKKTVIIALSIFFIAMLPLIPYLVSNGTSRYRLVSITDDPGVVQRINQARGHSKLPSPLPRVLYNKITFVSIAFTENYLSHFTPGFLFISGAPHKQHNVQNMGELYWFQAPFLLFGLYLVFKKKFHFRWLLLSWLLIIFIPVATTEDSIPNALRTLIAAPFYEIITALGLIEGLRFLRRNKAVYLTTLLAVFILAIGQFIFYLNQYYRIYPIAYSRDWQYGNKQVVEYIKEHQSEYDQIVFSRYYGEPQMFTLFYLQYDPHSYQTDPNLDRFESYNWVTVLKFGKFYMPNLDDPGTTYQDILKSEPGKKILFIGRGGNFPSNVKPLKYIYFLDGSLAFEIVASPQK